MYGITYCTILQESIDYNKSMKNSFWRSKHLKYVYVSRSHLCHQKNIQIDMKLSHYTYPKY